MQRFLVCKLLAAMVLASWELRCLHSTQDKLSLHHLEIFMCQISVCRGEYGASLHTAFPLECLEDNLTLWVRLQACTWGSACDTRTHLPLASSDLHPAFLSFSATRHSHCHRLSCEARLMSASFQPSCSSVTCHEPGLTVAV